MPINKLWVSNRLKNRSNYIYYIPVTSEKYEKQNAERISLLISFTSSAFHYISPRDSDASTSFSFSLIWSRDTFPMFPIWGARGDDIAPFLFPSHFSAESCRANSQRHGCSTERQRGEKLCVLYIGKLVMMDGVIIRAASSAKRGNRL